MKNKIIIILDVVFALAAVAGIVFFTIANNESNNLNGTLTIAKTSAISAKERLLQYPRKQNILKKQSQTTSALLTRSFP